MKDKYIALMDKALDAYSYGHIIEYFEKVKKDGLKEHGFPRLTANMGILIAHGKRCELTPLFLEMMAFCCRMMHEVKAANDFSVRELILCILELERCGKFDKSVTNGFRAELSLIEPTKCYNHFAVTTADPEYNWALFTGVSEFVRFREGIGGDMEFIETQIGSQLKWLDENGMYRDAPVHPPMMYDIVSRGLFTTLLHFGYRGRYYTELDKVLRGAALLMLKMQSVTGEMAFGGRSNQFLHNETWMAVIFEYEAARYKKEGDPMLAGRFKEAAHRALSVVEAWLSKTPIGHIKNRFPTETKYGCEKYAYFDKYMITVASFLYMAHLMCDDSIASSERDTSPAVFETSADFHKLFMSCGNYSLEFELDGDPHYDASGLGRVHRIGAPSTICMSGSCPAEPNFSVAPSDPHPLSLCEGVKQDGEWVFAAEVGAKYTVLAAETRGDAAYAKLSSDHDGGFTEYTVSNDGVHIVVHGKDEAAYSLPAFLYDGETYTEISADEHSLTIRYGGHFCRYETNGVIVETEIVACGRNGLYRKYYAIADKRVCVNIVIK
ncbi:MAG: hypothetical protein IJ428_01330 [Clostridia bacterium]|nr:hypothetical protein [Clostridia bacterium]